MDNRCPKCQTENTSDSQFCKKCATPLPSPEEISVFHTKTLETPVEELTTGSTFAGRYQIIEELGKGGMGKVYRVIDKRLNEEVALKLIKPEIASDKKIVERFGNELKLARKIVHKNIARMFDLNEEKDTHYITMEYVRGEDLKRLIRKIGQLSAGQAIPIAKQVCEGLAEAHRLGVVHRDLKPQNIMVDEEGNARIMDFGIARSLKARGITGAGVIIGTPEYMSPEQVEGKEVDKHSDIYSLGVILYEMVTGQVPFKGETAFSIAFKHKSEIPKDPKEFNAQIPEDLSRVILRCMEKDEEKRYQTVEVLFSELSKIEKGIPTAEKIIAKEKPETETINGAEWENSIAVLPFADLSPHKDQEYFCDGMAEELINALTKIEKLQVASRTSAFQFKEKGYDIHEIGKKLKVKSVLEGSVRKAGNRLRITAQLINVEDGYHLWSEKYDRDLEDIFAIQDEISLAIIDKLKVKLLREEKAKLIKRHTDNLEAYNLYLKGLYFWNRRHEGDLKRAIDYFQQAIKKDPLYAFPYIGIADTFNLLGHFGFLPPGEAFPKAKAAAKKALEIDDTLGEAHTSLGWISTMYDWDWLSAENEYKLAIKLNPNYATAHEWYALFLAGMERFDEAIAEMKRAQALDPLSLMINAVAGVAFYFARQYDKAIEQYQKTIEMNPSFSFAHLWLGMAYLEKAKYEEAVASLQKGAAAGGDMTYALGYLGMGYGLSGQKDEAIKILDKLKKISKEKYVSPSHIGFIYFGLGEKSQFFKYFNKACSEREPQCFYSKAIPHFDGLRSDPRFKALLKKMNLE